MKKRVLALLSALCLAISLCAVPAGAAEDAALQTIRSLGIMQGDENGNLNLDQSVTRAQFVTMMTNASSYKDTISMSGSGYSLYKDVKSSHWASEYIRVAVNAGWFNGYIDGTFRPDQTITLEEACTALLRLLGYDNSTLGGSFPTAQLTKAASLGLRDQLSAVQGQTLTRRDCVTLFYNLLTAKTAQGQTYASTLGYTVSNGQVDYTSVVKDNLSGPYIAQEGQTLPFTPTTVYRNGTAASSATLNRYDVYYYNQGLGTLWVYTDKAAGRISALSPSSTNPSSVTVGGKIYSIGSASAAYQLSILGGGGTGATVTLLLGMDDAVVGVVTGEAVDTTYYGLVRSSKSALSTDGSAIETQLTVDCSDGLSHTFALSGSKSYSDGALVSVSVMAGKTTVKTLSKKTLSGKVTADGIGDYDFAANVQIADTTEDGGVMSVSVSDLTGTSLTKNDVVYYVLDESGDVSHLLLNDVTGGLWTYAFLTNEVDNSTGISISKSYTYLVDGQVNSIHTSGKDYPVNVGGIAILKSSDGSIASMQSLKSVTLTELGTLTAKAKNQTYSLGDGVQVYLRSGSDYYYTTLSAIDDENYTLTGWYDTAVENIRIIIAKEK